MKTMRTAVLALLAVGMARTASAQTIVGSQHDFSAAGWSGGKICVACHTPHGADTTVTTAPLWNHAVTAKTFALYASPTLNATGAQPDGDSKLCLSCHDGTVAVDSFGGATGTTFMSGGQAVGAAPGDLANDHPVSFLYDATLATADGGLHNPATTNVTIGSGSFTKTGTIAAVLLRNGKLQCSSCHDVHNNYVVAGTPLLKMTEASSALCLACHNK